MEQEKIKPLSMVLAILAIGAIVFNIFWQKNHIVPPLSNENIKTNIIGTWAIQGDENATIVIDSDSLDYVDSPDGAASFPYSLEGSHMKVRYDDFFGEYTVEMPNSNTLILNSPEDGENIFYRFPETK